MSVAGSETALARRRQLGRAVLQVEAHGVRLTGEGGERLHRGEPAAATATLGRGHWPRRAWGRRGASRGGWRCGLHRGRGWRGLSAHSGGRYQLARFNVLDPNYRGSTGFSRTYQEAIKEDGWGGREQDDICKRGTPGARSSSPSKSRSRPLEAEAGSKPGTGRAC